MRWHSQFDEIDFGETFSQVAMITYIKFMLFVAPTFDLEIEHMHVKTTFLHGDLKEEIYMTHP